MAWQRGKPLSYLEGNSGSCERDTTLLGGAVLHYRMIKVTAVLGRFRLSVPIIKICMPE